MVAAMKAANMDNQTSGQMEELTHVWDRVTQLTQVREARLQEALKLVRPYWNISSRFSN